MKIVEGGCVPDPSGLGGGLGRPPKPTKQDAERLVTRVDRFVHVAGWPWRAVRRALRKARWNA
jgi:hypothetical protein